MSSDAVRRGKLVVISGPSGAGKTSICNALLERLPGTVWSVSATTRPPRAGETSGESYEFISREEFEARVQRQEFLETAEYCGQRYGTPAGPIRRWLAEGRIVVMEIDVQGGIQVARSVPESVRVFVLPPDFASLRARLEGRKTESEEHMRRRLAAADGEIAVARDSGYYQYFVTNDVLEATIEEILGIVKRETNRT
jgi:guanylate kinase